MAGQFIKSAANYQDLPSHDHFEVALAGRSNAGKSSLLNAWVGQAAAHVSQNPGKTTLLNFFLVKEKQHQPIVLVDMPGYGYAKRSKTERKSWEPLIEQYLLDRPNLKGVILVMDAQRPWTAAETDLLDWLAHYNKTVIVAANKVDRMNQKERAAMRKDFGSQMSELPNAAGMVEISARTKEGIEQLKRSAFENWLKV